MYFHIEIDSDQIALRFIFGKWMLKIGKPWSKYRNLWGGWRRIIQIRNLEEDKKANLKRWAEQDERAKANQI